MAVLRLESVTKQFGGLTAISGLSFSVEENSILGLIGPNGAGKTTIINLITGFYKPTTGKIFFNGADITSRPIAEMGRLGIARTFQNIRLFKKMTALENVLIGDKEDNVHPLRSVLSVFQRQKKRRKVEQAVSILEMMGLSNHVLDKAGSLAYGDQRRLEIARCLATEPELLLLDEPAAGMNEEESAELIEDVKKIGRQVKAIVLVEHDLTVIRQLCTSVIAVDYGKKIVEGSPAEVLSHPAVVEAYMGGTE